MAGIINNRRLDGLGAVNLKANSTLTFNSMQRVGDSHKRQSSRESVLKAEFFLKTKVRKRYSITHISA